MTETEYLASESRSEVKREWVNGEAFAMAGGTPVHALVVGNVTSALGAALRGKPCRTFSSELRVHIPRTGLYTYPDATVVCGPIELHSDGLSVTNPSLVCEVLSEGTESYDRGAKLAHYESVPTITDYLLCATDDRVIEHYQRRGPNQWLVTRYAVPASATAVPVPSLGIELSMATVYDGWEEVRAAITRATRSTRAAPPAGPKPPLRAKRKS
jgi:Uma2 family endonuclease